MNINSDGIFNPKCKSTKKADANSISIEMEIATSKKSCCDICKFNRRHMYTTMKFSCLTSTSNVALIKIN